MLHYCHRLFNPTRTHVEKDGKDLSRKSLNKILGETSRNMLLLGILLSLGMILARVY